MSLRFTSKSVATVVAAQWVFCVTALPLLGADRGKSIIVSQPKSKSSVTNVSNLGQRLTLREYFQDQNPDSLRPETTPDFGIQPPPRPLPPSRKQLEDQAKKGSWGARTDPNEAFGNQSAKELLNAKRDDAVAISGTVEGSMERIIRAANSEEDDTAEAFEEAVRRLREGDYSGTEEDFLNGESVSSSTNSYRSSFVGWAAPLKPVTSTYQFKPPERPIFEGSTVRSMRDEAPKTRASSYREFVEGRTIAKPSALPDFQVSNPLHPGIPASTISDFSAQPVFSGVNPSFLASPIEPGMARLTPFGSPSAVSPEPRPSYGSVGGLGIPGVSRAPTALQPFGALPQRNF